MRPLPSSAGSPRRKRQQHARPGARLESRDLACECRRRRARPRSRLEIASMRSARARAAPSDRAIARVRSVAREQRPNLADGSHIALEAAAASSSQARLGAASSRRRAGARGWRACRRPFVPGDHDRGSCSTRNRASSRTIVASRRASSWQAQRRHGARGDLAVDGGESADGTQAEDAHDGEHDNDNRGCQENFEGDAFSASHLSRELPLPAEAPEPAGLPWIWRRRSCTSRWTNGSRLSRSLAVFR